MSRTPEPTSHTKQGKPTATDRAAPTALFPSTEPLPSSLADRPLAELANAIQAHLLTALQGIQRYSESRPAAERGNWQRHIGELQTLLQDLHKSCPTELLGEAEGLTNDGALDPARVKEFGDAVARARKEAGLSPMQLAKRAGISERTVRNVEQATNIPTHATILRLLSVREMGLSLDQVPWMTGPEVTLGSAPNCWLAPGYDPLKMFIELFEIVNGRGGSLEQTYAYLDHRSAVNWYQLANRGHYAAVFRERMPLGKVAEKAVETLGHVDLDVICLGSGDGKQEVRLVEHLLSQHERLRLRAQPDVRLYLLDISQPLLSAGYQHAAEMVGQRGVYVCAIQGNFHHWPQYTQLHHSDERGHRRRIVCMLGNTLGNLDNEARFFQHTLIGLGPQDLLLVDVQIAQGSTDRPDEIPKQDQVLMNGLQPEHQEWLGGPLYRYCQDARSVSFSLSLDIHGMIPGSYSIDVVADVTLEDRRQKRFSVFRFKRYDPKKLAAVIETFGWEMLAELPFGPDESTLVRSSLLFRKRSTLRPS
jgi:transcriptional regulator with XRE-family HTH domain